MTTAKDWRMAAGVVAVTITVAMSGCSGGDGKKQAVPSTSTSTTTAPPEVSTTTVPSPPPGADRLAFPADTRPDISTSHAGFPVLVAVTKERHTGYDRYLFEFSNSDPEGHSPLGSARPTWDVRYVPRSEVVMDGSGKPVDVRGSSVLRVLFTGANMHNEDGSSSLRRSVPPDEPLAFGGDFEAHVTWFLGLGGQRPFRAVFIENRNVAVDVAV